MLMNVIFIKIRQISVFVLPSNDQIVLNFVLKAFQCDRVEDDDHKSEMHATNVRYNSHAIPSKMHLVIYMQC